MKGCPYEEVKCNACQSYKGKGYKNPCQEGFTKNWYKLRKKEKTPCELPTRCAECEHRMGGKKCRLNLYKPKFPEKKEYRQSLCWDCIRSAAPPGLRCIWDASNGTKLPEGATFTQEQLDSRAPYLKIVVLTCPQFLSMYDRKNQNILKKARN